jgi:diguanylate cyclase (GGDEF)-like protein
MRARVGAIYTVDDSGALRIAMARGVPAEVVSDSAIRVGEGVVGQVAERRASVLVPDLAAEESIAPCEHERHYRKSMLCAPIVFRDTLWGVICVNDRCEPEPFGEDQRRLLDAIAGHAAVALLNAESYERLLDKAQHDPLSGLWNHGHFWSTLTAELSRASRYSRQLSVVMIDADHFKTYNDTRGHMDGDRALVHVARAIEGRCRASDLAARYGGDEFAVILPETPLVGAVSFGEKIRHGVAELQLLTGAGHPITASVGVASYPESGDSAAALMSAADEQLYRAKSRGRNCVCGPGYESR